MAGQDFQGVYQGAIGVVNIAGGVNSDVLADVTNTMVVTDYDTSASSE